MIWVASYARMLCVDNYIRGLIYMKLSNYCYRIDVSSKVAAVPR